MECVACGGFEYTRLFTAQEKLFGTNESFDYFQCKSCHTLQIARIPHDIGRHYPTDYYSIAGAHEPIKRLNGLRRFVRSARTDYYIDRLNPMGWAIDKILPNYFELSWEWFRGFAKTRSSILDVGCGHGELLRNMHAQGFNRLTGVDPFVLRSVESDGLRILRGELNDLNGHFDFVMLHHSLEHMPDPLSALCEVRRLLRRGGSVLVRLPVADTFLEKHYGINWIGLDAPRHLFVPSRAGLNELARRAGFTIIQCWFDTTDSIILASETIARGLSPYDRKKKKFTCINYFSPSEIVEARNQAAALNESEDGDTACFVLRVVER
jgi:SAM-dependent methyltransferase